MSLERNKNPKRAASLKIFFEQLYDLVWHVIFQKYFANIIRECGSLREKKTIDRFSFYLLSIKKRN